MPPAAGPAKLLPTPSMRADPIYLFTMTAQVVMALLCRLWMVTPRSTDSTDSSDYQMWSAWRWPPSQVNESECMNNYTLPVLPAATAVAVHALLEGKLEIDIQ